MKRCWWEDWNAYAGDVPTVLREMADLAKTALTFDGNLALLASPPNPAIWAFKVRTDWLANLGLEVPTTPEELLEVARKFTHDDPDGNGKDDTYAFTSAGNKMGVGEIRNLLQMYAAEQTFGIKDNAVTHPIVSGDWEQLLMLLRTIVSEKLIDPDWYTISWNDRKPALFAGKYGFSWYPGVLANESENGTGNTGKTIGWWQTMATPVGSERGGMIPDGSLWGVTRTVSAEAASDAVKMARILRIIEDTAYPNDGFWKLRWGVEIDGFVVNDAGDGWKFMNVQGQVGVNKRGYCDGCNLGLYDWGYSIGSRGDKLIEGSSDELAGATLAELEMNKAALRLPTYPRYDLLLSLDPDAGGRAVRDTGRVRLPLHYRREFRLRGLPGALAGGRRPTAPRRGRGSVPQLRTDQVTANGGGARPGCGCRRPARSRTGCRGGAVP